MTTWAEVSARRLARHGLALPHRVAPDDVAADVVGVHAQVPSAAEVSLGLRLARGTRTDVRRALAVDRTLVRTFGPRGTVHLLAARDLPRWTGALSALPPAGGAPDAVALTAAQTDDVVAAIAAALADAELTVDELDAEVVARTGPWAGERVMPAFGERWARWRQAVTPAAHRGVLCFGPDRGRRTTYTHPRRFWPDLGPAPAAASVRWLVGAYLRAYGPATPDGLARWLAVPTGWAAGLLTSAEADLVPVDLAGTSAWALAGDGPADPDGARGVHLLPLFDAYVVGAQPRRLLFPTGTAARALPGGQPGRVPVVLVDGVVAGVWHGRRTRARLDVTVEAFRPLTVAEQDEVAQRAARIGDVLEATPRLTFGPVGVGPHA